MLHVLFVFWNCDSLAYQAGMHITTRSGSELCQKDVLYTSATSVDPLEKIGIQHTAQPTFETVDNKLTISGHGSQQVEETLWFVSG